MSTQRLLARIRSSLRGFAVSVAAGALLSSVACRSQPPPDLENQRIGDEAEIAWFKGEVDEAFGYAASVGKPLFLYWGAEWCPPCHYLKTKIFKRPEFVAKLRDFIPVYLDGDTERAQVLGEKLEVKGYPTVIIFDPLGQEVMRMPSAIPVEQYEAVLDAAMASTRPIKALLEDVLAAEGRQVSRDDLRLLAFYSWDQDSKVDLPIDQRVRAFRQLYKETPEELPIERSRFLGLYLQARSEQVDGATEIDAAGLSSEERAAVHARVLEILDTRELRTANMFWVSYLASSLIDLLQPTDSAERHQLIAAWQAAADAMESDESLSVDDRLTASLLKVDLALLQHRGGTSEAPTIPADLMQHVRLQAAWAIETVTDESELQTVMNTLAHLLDRAGLGSEAEALLMATMTDTAAPYYFMSWIAGLREDAGDTAGALAWHRQAYDSARGRYSRFRWGSRYLQRLMALAPDRAADIEADSLEILGELLTHQDSFAGGNHSRLADLEIAYRTWGEKVDSQSVLTRIREFVHAGCNRYPGDGQDSQRRRCESFLVRGQARQDAAP